MTSKISPDAPDSRSPNSMPGPGPGAFLSGKTVRIIGKPESFSLRDFAKLVQNSGGLLIAEEKATEQNTLIDWLILAASANAMGGVSGVPWLTEPLRQDIETGLTRLLTETQFLQRLYPSEDASRDLTKLYTHRMLAELLNVSTSEIRSWRAQGWISPVREVGHLAFYDIEEVFAARRLATLAENGVRSRMLKRKVQLLRQMNPTFLAFPRGADIVIQGKEVLLRRPDGLIESSGQKVLDFEAFENEETVSGLSAASEIPENLIDAPETVEDYTCFDSRKDFESIRAFFEEGSDSGEEDLSENLPTHAEMRAAAEFLEKTDELPAAAEMYRNCLLAFGANVEDCTHLGVILRRMGDLSAARERFFMALELDETSDPARLQLAQVLEELGEAPLSAAARHGAELNDK